MVIAGFSISLCLYAKLPTGSSYIFDEHYYSTLLYAEKVQSVKYPRPSLSACHSSECESMWSVLGLCSLAKHNKVRFKHRPFLLWGVEEAVMGVDGAEEGAWQAALGGTGAEDQGGGEVWAYSHSLRAVCQNALIQLQVVGGSLSVGSRLWAHTSHHAAAEW